MSMSACLSVCLSVRSRSRISETACPDFTKLSMLASFDRGSGSVIMHPDLVDDIMFA